MAVILEFVLFVEIVDEGHVLFQTGFRRMLIVLLFLALCPDHVHHFVHDRMVGGFVGYVYISTIRSVRTHKARRFIGVVGVWGRGDGLTFKFLPERNSRHAVFFESDRGGQVVLAAPIAVHARRRPANRNRQTP